MKRRLETVPGVGAVNLVGEATREIQVIVDRARLEAYHVSLSDVVMALQQENVDAAGRLRRPRGHGSAGARDRARAHGGRHRGHPGQAQERRRPSTCATWPR